MAERENDRVPIIYDDTIVIDNTTNAVNSSSGALRVIGGISVQRAAYIGDNVSVQGNLSINNVDITPNLNDIVLEQQATLLPSQEEFIDVTNFYFDNSLTSAFRAYVNVYVTGDTTKYALWEINGILQGSTWVIASSFTGELTGVQFRIIDDEGFGRIQYTNSNGEGSDTYIRFTAKTTALPGTNTQFGETVIQNKSLNFIPNGVLFASTADTLASSPDFIFKTGRLELGPVNSLTIKNTKEASNFTTGSITTLGGVAVNKKLIVSGNVGVGNDNPTYPLDINGNINFTGDLYQNGVIYSGSSLWQGNENKSTFYTAGNVGIGTTNPNTLFALDIVGDMQIEGDILPNEDSVHSLGSETKRFKDLYLAGNTIYIGDSNISATEGSLVLSTNKLNLGGLDIVATSGSIQFGNTIIPADDSATPFSINSTEDSTNLGNSGALIVLGGASIAKSLYIGSDLNANGTIYSNGTAVFSDRRVKENVQDVDPVESLNKILALRVKTYNYTSDFISGTNQSSIEKLGFIAQEVKEIIPQAVENRNFETSELKIPDFHYLNHDAIFTEAIAAIQELHRQLQEAKKEIEELKKQ
jgi:hypothetical protein